MPPLTQFSNDGLTFDVIDSGPADGEPVVLLHGFPQRAACWDAVAGILHGHGLRTIAPDQRGYSPGARPKGRRAYSIPRLTGDITALVDRIGGPVHLAGHDWGSLVAWALAANFPDRVATLTAVSVGHPSAFRRELTTLDQAKRSWYMLGFQIPFLPERALASSRATEALAQFQMTPDMIEAFVRDIVAYGAVRGGLNWYRGVPFSPQNYVGRVAVPTTMIWSDADAALGRAQAAGSVDFVDGPFEFVSIAGASHWLPEERPEQVAAAILARIRPDTELP